MNACEVFQRFQWLLLLNYGDGSGGGDGGFTRTIPGDGGADQLRVVPVMG